MKLNASISVWVGRIISALCVLFNIVDAGMKIAKSEIATTTSAQLGWPAHLVQTIGIIYMICTILYVIPRTAILGAVLITGYLGGAIAIMLRVDSTYLFPLVFGAFVWVGLILRNESLRNKIIGQEI